jgi:hypothetical protein
MSEKTLEKEWHNTLSSFNNWLTPEANSHSANQEIPSILWKPKVHYHVHKGSSLVPVLCYTDPVPPSHTISLTSILTAIYS